MRIPVGSITVQFAAGGLSNYVKNALSPTQVISAGTIPAIPANTLAITLD
jgi:hypothetical protein